MDWMETMPSKVSTVGGNQSVDELRRELAEAREQQAATAEILASISSSATDAGQVFANIAASAACLCDAHDATIFQVDGGNLRIVAHHGPIPPGGALPLTRGFVTGSAVLVYGLLFEAAAETLKTIARDPEHLGAEIGFTAVLHTWGRR